MDVYCTQDPLAATTPLTRTVEPRRLIRLATLLGVSMLMRRVRFLMANQLHQSVTRPPVRRFERQRLTNLAECSLPDPINRFTLS